MDIALDVGVGLRRAADTFALDTAKSLVWSALTFGGYGTYQLLHAAWVGYSAREGGDALGAFNAVNPIHRIATAIEKTADAIQRDDYRAAGEAGGTAAILAGTTVLTVVGIVESFGGPPPVGAGVAEAGAADVGAAEAGAASTETGPGIKIPNNELGGPPPRRGSAPIGKDGHPVELHHRSQAPNGPLDEMTLTEHRGTGNFTKNHSNIGQGPSKIDRGAWKNEQKNYWKKEWDSGRFDDK